MSFMASTMLSFSPRQLFGAGEQGVWYDPSDLYTMFSDAAGTTPVTAVETAVGLILDKSKNGVGTNGTKRVNLLAWTEDFSNAVWTKTNTTISTNTVTAPDGTTTADTITDNSTNAAHRVELTSALTATASTTYTLSIYAKQGTAKYLVLRHGDSTAGRAYAVFALDTGTVTGTGVQAAATGASYVSSSISNAGSGWYRCSMSFTPATSGLTINTQYGFANASTDAGLLAYVGSGSTMYIWGAQLEAASSVSTYQPINAASWAATMSGNHATQSTSASRPVLSARYNLLTKSEVFSDSAWYRGSSSMTITNDSVTAPDGTTTADTLTANAADPYVAQVVTSSGSMVASVYLKQGTAQYARISVRQGTAGVTGTYVGDAYIDLSNGSVTTANSAGGASTATVTSAAEGFYRISIEFTSAGAGSGILIQPTKSSSSISVTVGSSYIYAWGADLRVANDSAGLIPAYQRVNTSTDYDTAGFPMYLRADGTDDSLATSSIDFSGTDAVTVWAGVRKLSDAARGTVVELTATAASNNGSFHLTAPNAASATYAFESKGTSLTDAVASSSVAAPITNVLCAYSDISADQNILRVNGTQADSDTGDQGTGNFSNAVLYIGRRGGSSLPFNGRIYGLVVRGASSTTGEIADTERWLNGRTRAY